MAKKKTALMLATNPTQVAQQAAQLMTAAARIDVVVIPDDVIKGYTPEERRDFIKGNIEVYVSVKKVAANQFPALINVCNGVRITRDEMEATKKGSFREFAERPVEKGGLGMKHSTLTHYLDLSEKVEKARKQYPKLIIDDLSVELLRALFGKDDALKKAIVEGDVKRNQRKSLRKKTEQTGAAADKKSLEAVNQHLDDIGEEVNKHPRIAGSIAPRVVALGVDLTNLADNFAKVTTRQDAVMEADPPPAESRIVVAAEHVTKTTVKSRKPRDSKLAETIVEAAQHA